MFVASVDSGLMNCFSIAPRVSAEKRISLSQAVERTGLWDIELRAHDVTRVVKRVWNVITVDQYSFCSLKSSLFVDLK